MEGRTSPSLHLDDKKCSNFCWSSLKVLRGRFFASSLITFSPSSSSLFFFFQSSLCFLCLVNDRRGKKKREKEARCQNWMASSSEHWRTKGCRLHEWMTVVVVVYWDLVVRTHTSCFFTIETKLYLSFCVRHILSYQCFNHILVYQLIDKDIFVLFLWTM